MRGRTPDGRLELEVEPATGCCGGACLWYRGPRRTRLPGGPDLEVGTLLKVAIRKRDLLLGSLLLYGSPLGALLLGGLLGSAWGDLGCLLGAAGGLTAALALAARLESRLTPRVELSTMR